MENRTVYRNLAVEGFIEGIDMECFMHAQVGSKLVVVYFYDSLKLEVYETDEHGDVAMIADGSGNVHTIDVVPVESFEYSVDTPDVSVVNDFCSVVSRLMRGE